MQDKAALGTRYTCFSCGCKFYDLNREVASCPKCSTDQAENPALDIEAIATPAAPAKAPAAAAAPSETETDDEEDLDLDDKNFNDDDDLAAAPPEGEED